MSAEWKGGGGACQPARSFASSLPSKLAPEASLLSMRACLWVLMAGAGQDALLVKDGDHPAAQRVVCDLWDLQELGLVDLAVVVLSSTLVSSVRRLRSREARHLVELHEALLEPLDLGPTDCSQGVRRVNCVNPRTRSGKTHSSSSSPSPRAVAIVQRPWWRGRAEQEDGREGGGA